MALIQSGGYTYYVVEAPMYDYDDDFNPIETDTIEMECLSFKKQPYPCVRISLSKKEPIATLHLVNYYKSCSVKEKKLEKHSGTIHMIQTILSHTINTYPHITFVELQDETFIHVPKKPLITARRLLLGQKGWYEEYLGALPAKKELQYTLNYLRLPSTQENIHTFLPPDAQNKLWWFPEHIKYVADKINNKLFPYLIGSLWMISADTIREYGITMQISPATPKQSGGFQRKLQRIYRTAPIHHVSSHRVVAKSI
jgi:hypothetical protein